MRRWIPKGKATAWKSISGIPWKPGGLADPNAVRALTEGAAEVVRTLARLGVAFNRTEGGALDLRYFGGQKRSARRLPNPALSAGR